MTVLRIDEKLPPEAARALRHDLGKLLLRAYNAEADNSIRTLRVGNVVTAKKRLEASRTAIAKLGRQVCDGLTGSLLCSMLADPASINSGGAEPPAPPEGR